MKCTIRNLTGIDDSLSKVHKSSDFDIYNNNDLILISILIFITISVFNFFSEMKN